MSYKSLKLQLGVLQMLLEADAINSSEEQVDSAEVLPPVETPEIQEYQTPAVYSAMEKVEPKNSKVKAAFVDKAVQGSTRFVFVIEELDRGDQEFHGRAAIACKHGGKLVYAGVSFPQRAKSPIPPNLYRMIPVRGSSMPNWVKPYIDSSINPAQEEA